MIAPCLPRSYDRELPAISVTPDELRAEVLATVLPEETGDDPRWEWPAEGRRVEVRAPDLRRVPYAVEVDDRLLRRLRPPRQAPRAADRRPG